MEIQTVYAKPLSISDISQCYFYHTMDLAGFGVVNGQWDLRGRFGHYTNDFDFSGKRVLDVGTGSGFLTFSAEVAGAREVVSFDMDDSCRQDFLPFYNKLPYIDRQSFSTTHNEWLSKWRNAYWFSHKLLNSDAKAFYGDVYAIPKELGQFDVSIVGPILEHLADPIKALSSISRVTSSFMIIVTPMLQTDEKIAQFLGDCELPQNDYVFWNYSRGVYYQILKMLNFEIERISEVSLKADYDGGKLHERFVITAKRM